MPSSKPGLLSASSLIELRDELNFILADLYSFVDIAMRYDGKGVIESLKYGGLGQDVSAFNGLIYIASGASGNLLLGTGLAFDSATGKLYLNVTTAGDILAGTANQVMARLPIGTTGQVLSVGGAHATGLQWAPAVLDTLYDANTILKADVDNTPVALTVAEQTLIGRITGGVIDDLTVTQIRTLLGYYRSDASIADDASVTGPTIVSSSHGTLTICNGGVVEASAEWEMGTSGTVELIRSTTSTVAINVADPGTDGKFNIGIGSTNPPIFKNRLGGARSPLIIVNYN